MKCPYCNNCTHPGARFCSRCGAALPKEQLNSCPGGTPVRAEKSHSRLAYMLLGLFLGKLGIHNFYAGYTGRGVAQLLITVFLWWLIFPVLAVWLWAFIEIAVVDRDAKGVLFDWP